jgi:hypothetical protein
MKPMIYKNYMDHYFRIFDRYGLDENDDTFVKVCSRVNEKREMMGFAVFSRGTMDLIEKELKAVSNGGE